MIDSLKKSLRGAGAAMLLAVLPVGAMSVAPAVAQMPGVPTMGEPYPLTNELVLAWVESYPAVAALGETLEERYDIPEGEDAMAGLAALGAVNAAMAELNGVVTQYGFTDFSQWTNVMLSVIFSYSILEAPAEQQAMLMGMFQQPQGNLDAVNANIDAVRTLVDEL